MNIGYLTNLTVAEIQEMGFFQVTLVVSHLKDFYREQFAQKIALLTKRSEVLTRTYRILGKDIKNEHQFFRSQPNVSEEKEEVKPLSSQNFQQGAEQSLNFCAIKNLTIAQIEAMTFEEIEKTFEMANQLTEIEKKQCKWKIAFVKMQRELLLKLQLKSNMTQMHDIRLQLIYKNSDRCILQIELKETLIKERSKKKISELDYKIMAQFWNSYCRLSNKLRELRGQREQVKQEARQLSQKKVKELNCAEIKNLNERVQISLQRIKKFSQIHSPLCYQVQRLNSQVIGHLTNEKRSAQEMKPSAVEKKKYTVGSANSNSSTGNGGQQNSSPSGLWGLFGGIGAWLRPQSQNNEHRRPPKQERQKGRQTHQFESEWEEQLQPLSSAAEWTEENRGVKGIGVKYD